jgi:hypothetical protein
MSVTEFQTNEIVSMSGVNSRIQEINNMFPVSVNNGGTGRQELAAGQILIGNGTSGIIGTSILPITKGGTGGTDKKTARTNLDVFTRANLYKNTSGSSGTINLSSSISNFREIEILYKNTDNRFDMSKFAVINSTITCVLLSATVYDYAQYTPALSLKASTVTINNSTLTWGTEAEADIRNAVSTNAASKIKIYRVVGLSY